LEGVLANSRAMERALVDDALFFKGGIFALEWGWPPTALAEGSNWLS
jgi:hypothetical protein